MITIVDYGVGNVAAIAAMLRRVGESTRLASTPEEILTSEKIILPGVGAFDYAMHRLSKSGLAVALSERATVARVPILGICLGMQLLMQSSAEGILDGFGWIEGRAVRINYNQDGKALPVPHMGWSTVDIPRPSKLFATDCREQRFYFAHTFHVDCENEEDIVATALYGKKLVAGIERDNIFGVQFHPEKSHKFGMALLKTFAAV